MIDEPLPPVAAPHSSVLYGRAQQLSAIARAAAAVEEHKAQFVLIEGESGFGKTALLRKALASLSDWPRHVAVADVYERGLPYGILNQLLAPFDQSLLGPVLAHGIDPLASTLTVGAELLALVDASSGSTIIAIDDAQWMDEQSERALWFAGRRSLHDRLLILIAARPDPTEFLSQVRRLVVDGERGVRLAVGGLSPDNVVDLARARLKTRLPRRTAQRLVAATDGNALHIRAVLEYVASDPDPVVDLERRLGGGALPLAPGFDTLMRESMGRLSDAARTVVHLVSVLDGRVPLSVLSSAAAHLPVPVVAEDVIDEVIGSGLVDGVDNAGRLELRLHHHRVGDAVLAELPVRQRQQLHRVAAQVVGGDRELRHRVWASSGSDDELADTLDRAARDALRHHEAERAVRYSLWAASLSSSPTQWQERLVQAGLCAITTRRLSLLVEATSEFHNLPASIERDLMLGSTAFALEDIPTARTMLFRAASSTPTSLRERVMVAVANETVATVEIEVRRYGTVIQACEAALAEISAVLESPSFDPEAFGGINLRELEGMALSWHAFASWKSHGSPDADASLSDELTRTGGASTAPRHAVMLITRGAIRRQQGRLDEAISDLEHGVALADVMRPSIAPFGRIELALAQFRQGHWDEAATTAAIALSLADDFGGSSTYGVSRAIAALVPAARGESAIAAAEAAEARSVLPSIDPTLFLLIDALGARAQGDRASVIRIARRALATEHPRAVIGHNWWQELLEEASTSPRRKQLAPDPLGVLSGREREVAHLAAQGLTNREMAQRLFVTVKGIEYHMGNVLAKLHLTSRRGIRSLLEGHDPSFSADAGSLSTRDAP